MQVERDKFIAFADNVIALEAEKKRISDEIKDCKQAFASSYNLEFDSIKDAVELYKKYLKDKEKFITIDQELANIVNEVIYKELEAQS